MSFTYTTEVEVEIEPEDILKDLSDDELMDAVKDRGLKLEPGALNASVNKIAKLLPDPVVFPDGRSLPAAWVADDILKAFQA